MMQNDEHGINLNPGRVISIDEIEPGFNYLIHHPIFSIDYIPRNEEMLAVDFNEVQHLGNLGFDKIMTPDEVAAEVIRSIQRPN